METIARRRRRRRAVTWTEGLLSEVRQVVLHGSGRIGEFYAQVWRQQKRGGTTRRIGGGSRSSRT
eukprot:9331649-Pyramimonas_sp.AAC.1